MPLGVKQAEGERVCVRDCVDVCVREGDGDSVGVREGETDNVELGVNADDGDDVAVPELLSDTARAIRRMSLLSNSVYTRSGHHNGNLHIKAQKHQVDAPQMQRPPTKPLRQQTERRTTLLFRRHPRALR